MGEEIASDTKQGTAANVPVLALRWPRGVADALGVSVDLVQRHHLLDELRAIRLGRVVLVPVAELEAWLDRNARSALDADRVHARDGRKGRR